ncbi:MAG: hypothetical protein RLZZ118_2264 [Bacteroidota bacterium]|jgi:hypothetical protein
MKKNILLFAASMLLFTQVSTATIILHQGFWGRIFGGYSDVKTLTGESGNIYVTCSGIGGMECAAYKFVPVNHITGISGNMHYINDLQNIAYQNIDNGIPTNNITIDGISVSWNSSPELDFIDITIN